MPRNYKKLQPGRKGINFFIFFFLFQSLNQKPFEAISRSGIFPFSLNMCVCTASFGHKEKRYRLEIGYTPLRVHSADKVFNC